MAPRHGPSNTIVIKLGESCCWAGVWSDLFNARIGTSSIVHETTHQPLLPILSSIVETVVRLKSEGHRVVLVSSGAIGVGLKRMDIGSRPKSLAKKQVRTNDAIAVIRNIFDCYQGTRCHRPRSSHRSVGQSVRTAWPADRPDSAHPRGHFRRE